MTGFQLVKKFPHILCNPNVYYLIHKCLPTIPILSHLDLVHNPTSYFLKTHLNIILSTPVSYKWSHFLSFPHQNPVCGTLSPHTCYVSRPPHSSRLYPPKNIGWVIEIINHISMYFSPFHSYLVPFGQNIPLTNLLSIKLSLHSSLNVSDQFSHPYKSTGKIIVPYVLFFKFLDSNLEEKIFCIEWQQAFPEFNLLWIYSWRDFWFVKFVPKYLTSSTLSVELLSNFILCDVQCYLWHGVRGNKMSCWNNTCTNYIMVITIRDIVAAPANKSNTEINFYYLNCGGQGNNMFIIAACLQAVTNVQIHSVTHKFMAVGFTK